MEKHWTNDQKNAIDARNNNILVSAAAGSGKTAVLVERVISLITGSDPVDVDRLLIVTFTKAAAAEMRSRISKALYDKQKLNPNDSNIKRQLSMLSGAQICTIDAFCMNTVKENFFKLNISQDFKVLDPSEDNIIKQNILSRIFDEKHENPSQSFIQLIELMSNPKNDRGLSDFLLRLYDYAMVQPFPIQWLNSLKNMYDPAISLDDSKLKKYVNEKVMHSAKQAIDMIVDLIDNADPYDEMYDKYCDTLQEDLSIFEAIDARTDMSWDDERVMVKNLKLSRLPSTPKNYDGTLKSAVMARRNLYKKILNSEIIPMYSASSEEYKQDCEKLYPVVCEIIDILTRFMDELDAAKRDINKFSFSDVMHFAIDLLFKLDQDGNITNTELADEYRNRFYEILVDEYQDTNSAQDTLFEVISNGNNLFMVGDVKQSIYGFRLAMPQIFNNKREEYNDFSKSQLYGSEKIVLNKNFRSQKGVCDFVNFVFSHLMSKEVGDVDYNETEYLNYGASYETKPYSSAELVLTYLPPNEDKAIYEAKEVAQYIINSVRNEEQINGSDGNARSVSYGDFAVLFRAGKNNIPVYSRVFKEYGIPVYSENKTGLFDNSEIIILVSLLKVIDNPMQDIPLLSTLMSVFYGYTPDDISLAKLNHPAKNLYSSILSDSRFSKIVDDLKKYREYSASMSVESLIRQILADTSYLSVVSVMGNAEQHRLNVMKFVNMAKAFDSGDSVGLTAFIRYIDSITELGLNVEGESVANSNNDCVQLMTVHKSKGLEFPICILADASHKYNNDREPYCINDSWGVGLKGYNSDGMYRYNSIQFDFIRNINDTAAMSENLRVLYVAMTRAKEKFVAFISDKSFRSHVNRLSEKIYKGRILPFAVRQINNDGDLLLVTALLHKNASVLREWCENSIEYDRESNFTLSFNIIEEHDEVQEQEKVLVPYNSDIVDEIEDRLSFSYPRKELSYLSAKRTASSLDEKEQDYTYFAKKKPSFMQKGGMTSAEKGTAMHAFMQYCDYKNSRDDLENEINRLVSAGYISSRQAESLNRSKLKNLFSSDFAERMFSGDGIYREIKVADFVPVSSIENTEFDDNVLIQGIADCVFEEDGKLVLVDYKTDAVSSENELLDKYKNQIAFYRRSVSKTLNKPVKEAMLYSFYLDKCCVYK